MITQAREQELPPIIGTLIKARDRVLGMEALNPIEDRLLINLDTAAVSTTISQPLTLNRGRFVQIHFDPNGGTPGLAHDLTQLIEELLDPERYASDQDPYTLVNYIMGVDRRLGFNIYSHYKSTHLRLKIGYLQAPACNLSATATSEEMATVLFTAEGGASDGLIFARFLNAAEKSGHDVQELLRLGYAEHRTGFDRVMRAISPDGDLAQHDDANPVAILLNGADFWSALDEVAPRHKTARAMRRLKLIHKLHKLPFVGYAIWRQGTTYQRRLIDAMEGGSFWRRNYGRFH